MRARTHARAHTISLSLSLSLSRARALSLSLFGARSIARSLLILALSLFFLLCVSLSCSLTYRLTSQCGTCELPQVCLAYTECLKHGSVILDGQDVCRFTSFVWTADALQTLLTATNMSTSDLACERNELTCHHAEDLNQNNCTFKDLKAVPGYCRATMFSEFGRRVDVVAKDPCWNGHEYYWKHTESVGYTFCDFIGFG